MAPHGSPSLKGSEAANYLALETLRDGRRAEIRALRPDDRSGLTAAVARSSAQSLYRRFFAVKRHFTEPEIEFFLNVDFVDHVALVAVTKENGRPVVIGGARYVLVQPGKAEAAFALIDEYQGHGIGAALLRHLAAIARNAGLEELIAEVLPDNVPMLKVFEKSGFPMSRKRESQVVHVSLRLAFPAVDRGQS
jgi:RimJ/RimL family protein N-acetyltransferase